jgi:hypothetical protein
MVQTVPYISKHKEMYIWNTIWDTIGPYNMQTWAIGQFGKDRSHRQFTSTKKSSSTTSDVRTHMILHEIHQRICADHNTNGKNVKEGYKVPMEQRVSSWSRYVKGKDGYCTNFSISILGKDIPCACRCINDSTWSYLSVAKRRRLGSPDRIRKKKTIRLRT